MSGILSGATVLITGASAGIGRELAREVAREAGALVLVARRGDELERLAAELTHTRPQLSVEIHAVDLTDAEAVARLILNVRRSFGCVDVLINNAGLGHIELLERASPDEIDKMYLLNINAVTRLTHAFLPQMISQGRGAILNMSSFFGVETLPGYAAYSGSKHFVHGFSESLRAELSGTGVKVSVAYPGPVQTAFWDLPGISYLAPPSFLYLPAPRVARLIARAFRRGRARIVPGLRTKLVLGFLGVAPRPFKRGVLATLGRLRRRNLPTDPWAASVS